VPQRKYERGANQDAAEHQGLVLFIEEDGSFLKLTKALCEGYTGRFANRDAALPPEVGQTLILRFEVNGSTIPSDTPMFIYRAVARLSVQGLSSESIDMIPGEEAELKTLAPCSRLVCAT
jgi:hypothetical protein